MQFFGVAIASMVYCNSFTLCDFIESIEFDLLFRVAFLFVTSSHLTLFTQTANGMREFRFSKMTQPRKTIKLRVKCQIIVNDEKKRIKREYRMANAGECVHIRNYFFLFFPN